MENTDRRSRARSAIQKVAATHDLPTDLEILSERWNTVARLGNSGVIARAATLADLARLAPLHSFQQEVMVCRQLSRRGAPVQQPLGDVVIKDGFPISLWHNVPGEMGIASQNAMVHALARIYSLGNDITLDEPWFAIVAEAVPADLEVLVGRETLTTTDAARLQACFDRSLDTVVVADLPGGFIHGDAQRKNAMAMNDTAVWIDFEDCCIGPYAWDLACLTMNPQYDTDIVLDEYAEISGAARTPTSVMPSLWALRDLQALTWMLLIQDEREPGFRETASNLLRDLLTRTTGD